MADPITDYDTLIAAMVDYLVDSDLTAKAPLFIQLAEAEFNDRLLFDLDAEAAATTATVAGDDTLAFPTRFRKLRSLTIGEDPTNVLSQLSVDDLRAKWADASAAKPENFAISGGQFILGPAPDAVYTATIAYEKGFLALSASNASNWLLAARPDLYLYGALIHAEANGWNDERAVNVFVPAVDRIIGQMVAADAIRRKGDLVGDVPATYF